MEKKPYIINNKGGSIATPYVDITDLTQSASVATDVYWTGRIIPDNPVWVFSPHSEKLISDRKLFDILYNIGPEKKITEPIIKEGLIKKYPVEQTEKIPIKPHIPSIPTKPSEELLKPKPSLEVPGETPEKVSEKVQDKVSGRVPGRVLEKTVKQFPLKPTIRTRKAIYEKQLEQKKKLHVQPLTHLPTKLPDDLLKPSRVLKSASESVPESVPESIPESIPEKKVIKPLIPLSEELLKPKQIQEIPIIKENYMDIQPLLNFYNDNINKIDRFYKDITNYMKEIINTLNQVPINCKGDTNPVNITFKELKSSPLYLEDTMVPYPKYKKEIDNLYNVIDNSIQKSYKLIQDTINHLNSIKIDEYKC